MVRRLRLWSGLVLFAYVGTHLINHALGLISLEAMEAGRVWFLALWRNPVGTVALYGALIVHFTLVMWSLYLRRRLRMPAWETTQIVLGLLIPLLLAKHVIGTRFLNAFFDVEDSYTYVVLVLWEFAPEIGLQQAVVLVITWLHGCMGLHYWLRLRSGYRRIAPLLYIGGAMLPTLALLGFAHAGREAAALARDPQWLERAMAAIRFPDDGAIAAAGTALDIALVVFLAIFAGVAAARIARRVWERRHGVVHVTYPGGRRVRIVRGATILETSRSAGIPHASVCGGRGRCSTCRVRIAKGLDDLPLASAEERRVLDRVGAAPNLRLACQTRPTRDIEVTPLLSPSAGPADSALRPSYLQGHEQEIAILFGDIRAFTRISEHKLPYDVVFLLNRYFRAMGEAVEHAGGRVDKFIGDGVMALFGITSGPENGCRDALAAARAMADGLDAFNRSLASEIDEPLRIGIGIHTGSVIVGEMGYGRATSVTAIGDAVNTASRLEALTKTYGCQLVVSERVEQRAGLDLSAFASHQIEVRGRREPLTIRVVGDARDLPEIG